MKKVVIASDSKVMVKMLNRFYLVSQSESIIAELEDDEIFYMEYIDGNVTKSIFIDFKNNLNNIEYPCSLSEISKIAYEIKLSPSVNVTFNTRDVKILSDNLSIEYRNANHGNIIIKDFNNEFSLKTLRAIEGLEVLNCNDKTLDFFVSFIEGYCFISYDRINGKIKNRYNFQNIQRKSNEIYMLKNNKDYLNSGKVLKLNRNNGECNIYNVIIEKRDISRNLHTMLLYFCQNVLFGNENYAKSVMTKNMSSIGINVIREYMGDVDDIIPVRDNVVLLKYRESESTYKCKKLVADIVDGKIDNLNIIEL